MLVLTRKEQESVIVAGSIEIVVLDIRHGKVRLGFNAPDDVRIDRLEVVQQIQSRREGQWV